jgi:predicted DNA-binding WGR domain protein
MEVEYIGWCNRPSLNQDKVWGIAKHGGNYVSFWGRRGKKLQKKVKPMSSSEVSKLIRAKQLKGYMSIDPDRVDEVYERFGVDIFMVSLTAKI